MFKHILKPFLLIFSTETAHLVALLLLYLFGRLPVGRWILRKRLSFEHPSLEREVFGIKFPNPVGIAAGFDKNARVYRQLSATGVGFIEIGTLTPKPQHGNPKPRQFQLHKDRAILNRMGFNNGGLDGALNNLRHRGSERHSVIVGANIGKNTVTQPCNSKGDYLKLFRNLYQYVDYFTVNVTEVMESGELTEEQKSVQVREILDVLFNFRHGQSTYRPILLKMSSDWSRERVDDSIAVLIDTQLDGFVIGGSSSSFEGITLNEQERVILGAGQISGAPVLERTIELVKYVSDKIECRYPIIGVGGIMTPQDAERMLDAGASLVQVHTGIKYNGPAFAKQISKYLAQRSTRPTA